MPLFDRRGAPGAGRRWAEVSRGTDLGLVVHVGSNCLADARTLAAQAESLGAHAVAALAPSYFKPESVDALIGCCPRSRGRPLRPLLFL